MRFSSTAVYTILATGQAYAMNSNESSVEVVVSPYSNGVEIDIRIEFAASQSDFNSTDSVSSTIPSVKSTVLIATAIHTACGSGGYPTTQSTPKPSLAATTQGFFLNSTGSPTATGRFQSPSLIDLAAFSAGSSITAPPTFLGVVVVATVALAVV